MGFGKKVVAARGDSTVCTTEKNNNKNCEANVISPDKRAFSSSAVGI